MTTPIDLLALPAPAVVEALSFEAIFQRHRADLLARYPACVDVIDLESEPLVKLLEVQSYMELLFRQRVNDAARANLLAYATAGDLDHKGAFYNLARLPGEADDRFRLRIQLRIAALAGNGTAEQYRLVALSASLQVADAAVSSAVAGHVDIRLRLATADNTAGILADVLAALNAPSARPMGVSIHVRTATPKAIAIAADLYRDSDAPTDLVSRIAANLPAALLAYGRLGRAVPRSWFMAHLQVQGIAAVYFTDAQAPAEVTPIAADEFPVMGTVALVDKGVML